MVKQAARHLGLALCAAVAAYAPAGVAHAAAPPMFLAPPVQPAPGAGSGQATLDVVAVVRQAVGQHPTVSHAVQALAEAGEGIAQARAGYFPQVRGGLSSEYDDRRVGNYDKNHVQRFSISATQMLYDFGKVASGVDQARASQVAARSRVLLAVDQVAQETAYAAVELQRYRALLKIAREQAQGVGAIAALARERRAQGASTLSDETQARSREQAARATILDMHAQLERWTGNLAYLAGVADAGALDDGFPPAWEGACDVPEPEWDRVPAVLAAEAERLAAQATLQGAKAQSYPTLTLEGTAGRALNAQGPDGSRNDMSVMLNMSMPFYQGGAVRARQRAASHAASAAQSAVRNARLETTLGLSQARSQSSGYRQRLGALDERSRSILLTRDLYRQQYLDLGTRTLLDLLNAEQEYHQARIERVNNLHDMRRMQISCLYNTGRMRQAFELEGTVVAGVEILP